MNFVLGLKRLSSNILELTYRTPAAPYLAPLSAGLQPENRIQNGRTFVGAADAAFFDLPGFQAIRHLVHGH